MERNIETLVKNQDLIVKRREQIGDAALKLFSRKGYYQTSVREIAEASGLSIGSLYSYIKTKEDILYLVYQRIFTSFQEGMAAAMEGIEDPALQMKAALEATLKIYDEFQDVVLLLYQESHALGKKALLHLFEIDRRYVSIFRKIMEKGNQKGQFRVRDPNLTAICILFLCAVWALKRWNLKGYSLEEVIQDLTDLVLSGVMDDKEKGPI
ncbi:MAG: TetR/AcrR family transcriptional regulator [candidate division NC10 bacterium]|nr:TetR/AcrR family transcriptional regulator [candidate division NC10 bacterium]